jgi:hypothetical protein
VEHFDIEKQGGGTSQNEVMGVVAAENAWFNKRDTWLAISTIGRYYELHLEFKFSHEKSRTATLCCVGDFFTV